MALELPLGETVVGRFCRGVVEAGWLAMLVMAALYFNPYSSGIFEPDKATLVRCLGLILAGAGVVLLVEERAALPRWSGLARAFRGFPLALPVAGLVAANLLASALSVNPVDSLLGSYVRLQGVFTLLAYVAVFVAMAATLRRRQQFDRVLDVVAVAGMVVGLYSLFQRLGLDWIDWGDKSRLTSTLGNPNFVAELLAMALPLTASGFVRSLAGPRSRTVVFGLAGGVQVIGVLLGNARGGLLGMLAGLFAWGLIVALSRGWQRAGACVLGGAALCGLLLVLLNLPRGPLDPLRRIPALERVSHVLASQSQSSYERELLWSGTARLMLPHAPLTYPDGHVDGLNALRPLVGYGPETMVDVFQPFAQPGLLKIEANTNWDRPHDEVLHAWASAGVLGALAYVWLFGAALFLALKLLLHLSRRATVAYIGTSALGAAALIAGALAWKGLGYIGVALSMALLLAFIGLLAAVVLEPRAASVRPYDGLATPLVAGAAGAVVAHLAAMQFGIATTSTWLLLWMALGVLAALSRVSLGVQPEVAEEAAPPARARRSASGALEHAWMLPAVLVALPAAALAVDFLRNDGSMAVWQTALLAVAGCLGLATLTAPAGQWRLVAGAGLGLAAAFSAYHLFTLSLGTSRPRQMTELLQTVLLRGSFLIGLAVFLGLLLALAGRGAVGRWPLVFSARPTGSTLAAMVAGGIALFGAVWSVGQMRADMVNHAGQAYETPGQFRVAARMYQEASSLAPRSDVYHLAQGQVLVQAAGEVADWTEQRPLMVTARDQLEAAERIRPLNSVNVANLAKVAHRWSEMTPDPADAQAEQSAAERLYAAAAALNPGDGGLWGDRARFELGPHRDYASGLRALMRADAYLIAAPDPYKELTIGWVSATSAGADEAEMRASLGAAVEEFGREPVEPALQQAHNRVGQALAPALDTWDAAEHTYEAIAAGLRPAEARAGRWLALSEAYAAAGNRPLAQMAFGGDGGSVDNAALCARLRASGAPLSCRTGS